MPLATPLASSPAAPLRELAALAGHRGARAGLAAIAAACAALWAVGYTATLGEAARPVALAAAAAFEAVAWVAACAGGAAVGWLLPQAGRSPLARGAAVAGFALAFGIVRVAAEGAVQSALGLSAGPLDQALAASLPLHFLVAASAAGVGAAVRTRVMERERAAAAARDEAERARERRRAVHGHLRPERLLASLDAVSRRIGEDAAAADRLLLRLAGLLRRALARAHEATLGAEPGSVVAPPPGGRVPFAGPVAWLGVYWLAAAAAYTASVLYLGLPTPDVAGVPLLGAAARASVSATVWSGACAAAFALGLARAPLAPTCAAATAAVWLLFLAQAALYCRAGWGVCLKAGPPALTALPLSLLMAASMVVLGRASARAARHREAEIRADRLDAGLARARLDTLAAQLRPHFLFNTLQSVATLVHRDPAGAREMLAGLRTLLERSTRAAGDGELPLEVELELLALYTGIERVRFGDRLRVEVEVAPGARRALVPHLLLQPLVENAVRHAVARRGAGTIRVRADADGAGWLRLEVRDNGEGLAAGGAPEGTGVGLENTRARLRAHYGARQALALESRPGEGLTVRVRIPLRRAGEGRGEG